MELKQAIETRRSINYFDPNKNVDKETINKILDLAALAPSSFNLQPWKVITVLSDEKKELLKSVAFNQPKVTEASVVFILLADLDFVEKNLMGVITDMVSLGYMDEMTAAGYAERMPAAQGAPDSAKRLKSAVLNSALFGMNLMYACSAYGLESHPMGGFDEDKLKAVFEVPETLVPVMLIAAGYLKPGIKLLPRVKRLSFNDFNTIL